MQVIEDDESSNIVEKSVDEPSNDKFENDNTVLNNELEEYQSKNSKNEILDQNLINSQRYDNYKNSATLALTRANTQFTSKTGYFFIQISGDGKTTKRKVAINLSSTNLLEKQTVKLSEVGISGYSDNHNFKLITTTATTSIADSHYTIINIKFSYTKPAHFLAGPSYSNKVTGYRFNFNDPATSSTSVNNTGHNVQDTTETITMQVNLANCGINKSTGEYVAKNATGYINLKHKYYSTLKIDPNGGTYNGSSKLYTYGPKECTSINTINDPVREGYIFTGWTLIKGSNCIGASFNSESKKFHFCGESKDNSSISSNDICTLKANWKRIELSLPEAGGKALDILFIIIGGIIVIVGYKIYKKEGRIK